MSQRVIGSHFPYLPIHIQAHQRTADIEALRDTGFDGYATVPQETMMSGEPPEGFLPCTLADGSQILAPFYRGTVQIGNLPPSSAIILALGDEALIGLSLITAFTIILDHGRQISVEP